MIPYGRQEITQADIDAVVRVLQSDYLTQGPLVPRFEQAVASYCGAQHAVAMSSATSALHLACLAIGVGVGDTVWTSPITFVASANCAVYCGAKIDFVDIDPRTYNLCPQALAEKLSQAKIHGNLPKVVIPVHFSGQPCDMQAIRALAQEYGFRIIEDASHAIGGRYKTEPIGNCHYGDITIFSFHPVKIITTGEGGMALTNDADLANKMRLLRSHGITRDQATMAGASDGPWYYQQVDLGFNFRMTDLQAALGVSQMARLDAYVSRRQQLAKRYEEKLAGLPITLPWQHADGDSAWHLYVVCVSNDKMGKTRRQVFEELRARDIGVNVHYIPVHTQPYYRRLGFADGDFPNAESYYESAISLPMFATLSEPQQDNVVKSLKAILQL